MASDQDQEKPIISLTIAADKLLLPGTARFVAQAAQNLGLGRDDASLLESAVIEAGANVIDYAFDPDEAGTYKIMLIQQPDRLLIAIEDQGMPLDPEKDAVIKRRGMGKQAMHAFADSVRFINQGLKGKRTEMVKNMPMRDVQHYLTPEEKRGVFEGDLPEDKMPSKPRLLHPGEEISLSRCIYRSYGYTYMDDFYYPEKVRQLLDSERLLSVVMVDDEGEVVAHVAISLPFVGAKVGDLGQGVVLPQYRGKGLLESLCTDIFRRATEMGLYGFYGEAVTVHPYSQKAMIKFGAAEVGFLGGFIPGDIGNIGLSKDKTQTRQTVCLFYYRLNEEPPRTVYFPQHHSEMLHRMYDRMKLNREIAVAKDTDAMIEQLPQRAKLDISVQKQLNHTNMYVKQYGKDIVGHVSFMLNEACLHNNVSIYLDLPLSHPATAHYCQALESLGFFFSSVVPELRDGDVLRLQYMNNFNIEWDKLKVAGEFSRELLKYIRDAEQQRQAEITLTESRVHNLEKLRRGD